MFIRVHLWLILLLTALPLSAVEPQALADRIDVHIDAQIRAAKAKASPPASDAEFLRRAYLDITGRIPTPHDVHEFLASTDPAKRAKLIDELLETPRHASHFAAVWRAALVPEVAALQEARVFRPGFEAWLRSRFRENVPYDVWVRELLTVPLSNDAESPTPALRRPEDPNPLAFFAVKESKPENLAAAASRVFLGVQIECAQCHDHPFARWTRDQFWNTAAFFAGLDRHGDDLFAAITEDPKKRTISPGTGKADVPALFLDGTAPVWSGSSPREPFAAWLTAKENDFFAKSTVNRVWGHFFGRGLVDPVDDFRDDNPPSHPELLDELAKSFADSGFDLRFLVKSIARTKAYQRSSARTDSSQDDPKLFARSAVRGLTGEQFAESFEIATGIRGKRSPRDALLSRFALTKPAEPETSIPQALALMNGSFTAEAASSSPTLRAICEIPGMTTADRVEALYLASLGRKPTANERERMTAYVDEGGTGRLAERLGDVFWVLLNSAEFRFNH